MVRAMLVFVVTAPSSAGTADQKIITNPLPALPRATSNNAVARVRKGDKEFLVSLMGLASGKTWKDVHAAGYVMRSGGSGWMRIDDVPGPGGRLAGTAVGVGSFVYVIGGYTVAADGEEVSVGRVQRLDPVSGDYIELAPMSVPVDDAVSLVWRDRYVYLVSGWHDSGNVNLVQVYDLLKNHWFQATPYPGQPVFGHAGGIVGSRMIICDGVAIMVGERPPRTFEASDECFHGRIDENDPSRIEWTQLPDHGGLPLYRMASAGSVRLNMVVFAGGSDNPYNYNGIGYDGVPSRASSRVFGFDLRNNVWKDLGDLPFGTMDHRGLLESSGRFILIGGMRENQKVTGAVNTFTLEVDQ